MFTSKTPHLSKPPKIRLQSDHSSFQIVDGRLFTGSFDGTLRVWDLTELAADKGTGTNNNAAKDKNKPQSYDSPDGMEMKNQRGGQKMMIENERNYYNKQQPNPAYPNTNYNKSMDQRSEADSGFDDRDYAERYNNNNMRQGQPRRLQVKEIV